MTMMSPTIMALCMCAPIACQYSVGSGGLVLGAFSSYKGKVRPVFDTDTGGKCCAFFFARLFSRIIARCFSGSSVCFSLRLDGDLRQGSRGRTLAAVFLCLKRGKLCPFSVWFLLPEFVPLVFAKFFPSYPPFFWCFEG